MLSVRRRPASSLPSSRSGFGRPERDQLRRLRDQELNPAEAVYLDLNNGQEGVAFLSEAFTIPTAYFELECQDFTGEEGADERDPVHVIATLNDTRALSMEADELQMLQAKMAFYWVHARL